MFKEAVMSTALSDGYAESALGFVANTQYGFGYETDLSLTSTLRALLKDRIKEGEQVCGWWGKVDNYMSTGGDDAVWRNINRLINTGKNVINIVSVDSNPDKVFAVVDKKVADLGTYKKIEKVTAFFRKNFRVSCFVNESQWNTMLFVEGLDIRKFHFIQCCITLYLPWYFKPEEMLKDDELRLVKSLTGNSIDEYVAAIQTIADGFGDLRSYAIDRMLKGFERRIYKRKGDDLRQSIASLDRDIERYKDAIAELIQRRRNKTVELFGWDHMQQTADERDAELRNYFINNQHVDLAEVGNRLTFTTRGHLSFWEDDALESILAYDRSSLYTQGSAEFSAEDRKRLAIAIFRDRKIKIRICSAYYIDMDDSSMDGIRGYDYPSSYATYMPNPHIDRYKCIGEYARVFSECLEENNYTMAVDQAIVSGMSLNLYDGAVFTDLFERMFGRMSKRKYLELPDGSIVDTRGAIDFLNNETEGENEQAD